MKQTDILFLFVVLAANIYDIKTIVIHSFKYINYISKMSNSYRKIYSVPLGVVGFSFRYIFTICVIYNLKTLVSEEFSNLLVTIRYWLIAQPSNLSVQQKCQHCYISTVTVFIYEIAEFCLAARYI